MRSIPSAELLNHILNGLLVASFVKGKAQTGYSVDNSGSELSAMLANATSEDQSIDLALEGYKVGAEKTGNAIHKDVKGQPGSWFWTFDLGYGTELSVLPWINTTTASGTGKARQRRKPHTRVPALAALDGTCACTASKVQSDDI
ncbi:hypothetical protein HG530_012825 [Fusarium avenaceum]|nr:hypothetical protein HG530_012825 [Fusarium avenaceum]